MVSRLLAELGLATVIEATSAAEAIVSLQATPPDLVLTDWVMETPDAGLRVVSAAYEQGLPVLVISGAEPALPAAYRSVRWLRKTEVSVQRLRDELARLGCTSVGP